MNSISVLLYSISSVLFEKQITFYVVVLVVRQNAPMCEYVHYIAVNCITIDIVMQLTQDLYNSKGINVICLPILKSTMHISELKCCLQMFVFLHYVNNFNLLIWCVTTISLLRHVMLSGTRNGIHTTFTGPSLS